MNNDDPKPKSTKLGLRRHLPNWGIILFGCLAILGILSLEIKTSILSLQILPPGRKLNPIKKTLVFERINTANPPCVDLFTDLIVTRMGNERNFTLPSGCQLHDIDLKLAEDCVQNATHIVFMGDSRVRQIFASFLGFWTAATVSSKKYHSDMLLKSGGLTLEFVWMPRITSEMTEVLNKWLDSDTTPDIIIVGDGLVGISVGTQALWKMRISNATQQGERYYRRALKRILPYLQRLKEHSLVLWVPQDLICEKLRHWSMNMVTNKLVRRYNQIAQEVLQPEGIIIWWSSYRTALTFQDNYRDRAHLYPIADKYKIMILWNWICSNKKNATFTKSCCGYE